MQWRDGTHGSLRVEIDKGVFEDHETGQKGGTLKIIECRGGMDKHAPWLGCATSELSPTSPSPPAGAS